MKTNLLFLVLLGILSLVPILFKQLSYSVYAFNADLSEVIGTSRAYLVLAIGGSLGIILSLYLMYRSIKRTRHYGVMLIHWLVLFISLCLSGIYLFLALAFLFYL